MHLRLAQLVIGCAVAAWAGPASIVAATIASNAGITSTATRRRLVLGMLSAPVAWSRALRPLAHADERRSTVAASSPTARIARHGRTTCNDPPPREPRVRRSGELDELDLAPVTALQAIHAPTGTTSVGGWASSPPPRRCSVWQSDGLGVRAVGSLGMILAVGPRRLW